MSKSELRYWQNPKKVGWILTWLLTEIISFFDDFSIMNCKIMDLKMECLALGSRHQ